MGGEMLYILEQRLQAQKIQTYKGSRVLIDVVAAMFNKTFLDQIFAEQKIYTSCAARQIFEKLAHTSIMRLNDSSMKKLYDLITMGCKHQLMCCTEPHEIVQISLNHMDFFKTIAEEGKIKQNVVEATERLIKLCNRLTIGDYFILRQSLLQFFQDRRIKVSVFLQKNMQTLDGSIIMKHHGILPPGGEIPGSIRYFDKEENLILKEKITLKNQQDVSESKEIFNISKPNKRYSTLGSNIYKKKTAISQLGGTDRKTIVKNDLNQFAQIMGTHIEKKDETNSINLFPSEKGSKEEDTMIIFDAETDKYLSGISNHLETHIDESGSNEDDLLDLMDAM